MCIFCKIVNNEIPSYKVYEDNNVLAFLDISQVTNGHTLVIPKKHYQNIFELDNHTSKEIFKVVNELAIKMRNNLKINDLNIVNNNGKKAGQEVDHYHIHLIPRYDNDNVEFRFKHQNLTVDEMQMIQEKILGN